MQLPDTSRGRPLHPKPSRIILTAEEENRHILHVEDFVSFYGITQSYARKMIADLMEEGWLVRVGKGLYQLLPARTGLNAFPMGDKFVVGCQAFPGSFIAFGSAAEYHGLTTQVFPKMILANLKKNGLEKLGNLRLQLIKINTENYVGFEQLNRGPNVQMATKERTIIDCINRPDLSGGISDIKEILERGRKQIDTEKLIDYLASYNSKSLITKVGYLLEYFDYDLNEKTISKLRSQSQGVKAYLFSHRLAGSKSNHGYSKVWGLTINAPGFFEKRSSEGREKNA